MNAPWGSVRLDGRDYAHMVAELERLHLRVVALLSANNELVEQRRAILRELEALQGSFEQSQDDLATVRAELGEARQLTENLSDMLNGAFAAAGMLGARARLAEAIITESYI